MTLICDGWLVCVFAELSCWLFPVFSKLMSVTPAVATRADFKSFVPCDCWAVVMDGWCRYMVTHLMGADLNNIVKTQRLSDDHVQFLVYQILRGLKAYTPYILTHKD